jgi:molybdate transport system substrate-binding protein
VLRHGERALARRATLLGALLTAAVAGAEAVTVFAAASLTDAFRTIEAAFEAATPGTTVELNFAGSSTLVRQILEGAPADVFASADEDSMQKVAGEIAEPPQVFAKNRLAILVAKGNPERVTALADFARPGLTIALAAPAVPVGRYAMEAFGKAGVPVPPATNEADVKAVVTRVSMGEADAGVVYVTDAKAGGATVEAVPIPESTNVVARYPIAVLKDARGASGARAFVAFVLSPRGRGVLTDAGFLAP